MMYKMLEEMDDKLSNDVQVLTFIYLYIYA